jgi:hypothetical protein
VGPVTPPGPVGPLKAAELVTPLNTDKLLSVKEVLPTLRKPVLAIERLVIGVLVLIINIIYNYVIFLLKY